MAATERAGGILAAALALPGVLSPVHAETAPEQGVVEFKFLQYRDWQPGFDRVRVKAPSLHALVPLGERWLLEGSAVADSVSGASPRYHTAVSGASRMDDERRAGDVKLTRHFARSAYAVGLSRSTEHDYRSTALSVDARFASEDNNTTWNLGLGVGRDRIGSTNDASLHERRRTLELTAGVTQALTPTDLAQLSLTVSRGRGYFSDPYKDPDIRPDRRNIGILLARWNHHVEGLGASLRSSYRYYGDSYGIRAHTLGLDWVQPVGPRLTLTPELRYHTQNAARFYYDPVYDPDLGPPYPPGYFTNPPRYISGDQRLSAFGALTLGLKVGVQLSPQWSADLKGEYYEQRSGWRIGGSGSPGLAPLRATFWQVGVSRRF